MIGIAETSNWFPVPQVPSRAPDLKQRALESYGRLGGRERGGFSVIFSPANESSVRAKDFVIRWVPRVSVEKISLTIGADTGEELWRQNGVDGRSGQLFSETARQAVKKYRDSGAQGQLVLFFAEPGGSESRVVFWPLPVAAEYSLEQELNIWDRETAGLMRHICRAFSFARRSMFSEVADEYDVALEMDPESQDLLLTAIEAHRRTGNSLRVIELTRRLSKRPPD
jgi:hypothetical protein